MHPQILIVGLGRIGRQLLRQLLTTWDHQTVFVSDLNEDLVNLCYLLNYDSVYGFRTPRFTCDANAILDTQTGSLVQFVKVGDINKLDPSFIVIDSSGSVSALSQLAAHFSRIYITNSLSNDLVDRYVIANINEVDVNPSDRVVSVSICDTTAIAPVLSSIDSAFQIVQGNVLTLHPWLGYQNLTDNSVKSATVPKLLDGFCAW